MTQERKKHGRVWRFLFVLHLYAFLSVLALLVILAGSAALAWKVQSVRRFVHSEVVRLYLKNVAPRLPFTIQEVNVDARWSEFMHGWISEFELALRWKDWSIRLAGPIQISWDRNEGEKHLSATYLSKIRVDGPAGAFPELPLRIAFRAEADFQHLDSLSIETDHRDLLIAPLHLHLSDFALGASWSNSQAHIQFSAKKLRFGDEVHHRETELAGVELSSAAPLTFSPLRIGPKAHVELASSHAVLATEERKIQLPLAHLPMHAELSLSDPADERIELTAGAAKHPELTVSARLAHGGTSREQLFLNWKTPVIPLREFFHAASSALGVGVTEESPLSRIRNLSGSLRTQGEAMLPLPLDEHSFARAKINAGLSLRDVSLEWPDEYLALSGLDLELPFSSEKGIDGMLSISRILFRRLQGSLPKARIALAPTDSERKNFNASADLSSLRFAELPFKLGKIDGTIRLPASKNEALHYDLNTSMGMEPTDASSLAHALCINREHIPPARLVVDFPRINLTPGTVDPEGKLQVNLFKGTIELSELGFYDLGTSVPEIDFDLNMDGVRLDQLGDWAGFGKMDGTLTAYAHDVVFQKWLPTQYDFNFEAKPFTQTKVVFSPEAMKNMARLVASDAIDHLPGIANWLAFGFPSRMLGGFDIWFVGISLYSHGGHILLQVLDPPGLPINVATDHKQNHYILYANRFTIPLKTSQYPVVVDATAVSNYVHSAALKLLKLRQLKKAKEKNPHEKEPVDCDPPSL